MENSKFVKAFLTKAVGIFKNYRILRYVSFLLVINSLKSFMSVL